MILVTGILVGSVFYVSSLSSQVVSNEDQARSLKEQVATLQEQLSDTLAANQLDAAETSVPHPTIQDRDSQTVGDHTNVSWIYNNQVSGKYINFELELVNLGIDCDELTDPLECGHPIRFITSDGINHTSRIPTELKGKIPAGTYAWRVAPVPTGTVISKDADKDDLNRLSDWSNFGAFTIHRSLLERIRTTRVVRVGTNLEQDTRFSRRQHDGNAVGFDISLIHALIENCLDAPRATLSLRFDRAKCADFVKMHSTPEAVAAPPASCSVSTPVCVKLVPIQKWGDWQSALKRKEIDLFIGAVTAASFRERTGILFTPGYLKYETHLYGHALDAVAAHFEMQSWLSTKREVGVIESSTNEYLLDQLCLRDLLCDDSTPKKKGLDVRLHKHTFSSFPAMEHAMDRGEVDGVIIDETFVDHDDWKVLGGIQTTAAWKYYIENYLGTPGGEKVAIAVAVEQDRSQEALRHDDLYSALREALSQDSPITTHYLPVLCKAFWEGASSNFSCKSGPTP
jgi:ABC-type amino acid transport substrate-binding protein